MGGHAAVTDPEGVRAQSAIFVDTGFLLAVDQQLVGTSLRLQR